MKHYYIPANYVAESTILHGKLDLRRTVEGLILALLFLPIALLIPATTVNAKIYTLLFCCGPGFALGFVGFGGDPLSVVAKNALAWQRNKTIMLYNSNARPLKIAPLEDIMSRDIMKDKLLDYLDKRKAEKAERMKSENFVEGVNFAFENETGMDFITPDEIAQKREANGLDDGYESFDDLITLDSEDMHESLVLSSDMAALFKNASAPVFEIAIAAEDADESEPEDFWDGVLAIDDSIDDALSLAANDATIDEEELI